MDETLLLMPIPVVGGTADGCFRVRSGVAVESIIEIEGERYRLELVQLENRAGGDGETEWRYVVAPRPEGLAERRGA